eukprot:1627566-Prymnesium_polylepis.1
MSPNSTRRQLAASKRLLHLSGHARQRGFRMGAARAPFRAVDEELKKERSPEQVARQPDGRFGRTRHGFRVEPSLVPAV